MKFGIHLVKIIQKPNTPKKSNMNHWTAPRLCFGKPKPVVTTNLIQPHAYIYKTVNSQHAQPITPKELRSNRSSNKGRLVFFVSFFVRKKPQQTRTCRGVQTDIFKINNK